MDDTEDPRLAARRRAIEGSLLGTALGDALGLPFEGLSRRRVARWLRGPLRHRFFLGRGFCSDDTEHACMTGQALLAARARTGDGVEAFRRSLAWRLRFWLLGLPAGIGFATLRSLLKQWLFFFTTADGVRSAGNGPAMRSALIGACHGEDRERLRALVRASTRLTHTDPRAEEGALAVALAARAAAAGGSDPVEAFLQALPEVLPEGEMRREIEKARASAARGESTPDFAASIGCGRGVSGFILHSVPVALHAWFRHPRDYAAAIEAVVRCGGDTDTVGAITGGIVGAGVGPEGLPRAWVDGLWEWPRSAAWMRRLAGRLADDRPEGAKRGALPLNAAALMLRNLLFMLWVLLLGLRRVLPPY